MGEVYEAVDDVLGREVAIKTIRGAGVGLDDRFRHEARAIAQLSHPGIVQLFDIDLAADPPYLVMERVPGPSLEAQMPLPVDELVPLGIQMARALAAAHAAGIVHRDVKPANILAASGGSWKLADFGVAHVPSSKLTITGQFVGSPAYAPPEALVKGIVAPTGDVYGLGATLYEAASGRWPRAEAKGALLAPVPPLCEIAPNVPAAIGAAIDRAVAFEPDRRPSAAELADELAHAATGAPAVSMPVMPRAHPIRWQRWAVGGGIALALIVAFAATRGGARTEPGAAAIAPIQSPEIDGSPPPNIDGRAQKDWRKIIEHLRRHHFRDARHKLDEWEDRYGSTPETQALRSQLEAMPDERGRGDD